MLRVCVCARLFCPYIEATASFHSTPSNTTVTAAVRCFHWGRAVRVGMCVRSGMALALVDGCLFRIVYLLHIEHFYLTRCFFTVFIPINTFSFHPVCYVCVCVFAHLQQTSYISCVYNEIKNKVLRLLEFWKIANYERRAAWAIHSWGPKWWAFFFLFFVRAF